MDKGYKELRRVVDGVSYPFDAMQLILGKKKQTGCALHFHQEIELLYVENGGFNIWLDGKAFHAEKGDLVIINSNECHKIQSSTDNCYYKCIKCAPQILYTMDQSFFNMRYVMPFIVNTDEHKRVFTKDEISSSGIPELVANIHDEWMEKKYGFELSIHSDLLRIFLIIVRSWDNSGANLKPIDVSSNLSKTIQAAVEYVGKNYANASEAEAAKLCNLSYSYFSHSFKRVMNMSFKEYVNYVRINESQKLLISENKSVSEIAAELGFSSASHYIQCFKKIKGESPKQFKMNYLKYFLNG